VHGLDLGGLGEDGGETRLEKPLVNVISQQSLEKDSETDIAVCDPGTLPCEDSLIVSILTIGRRNGSMCVNMNVLIRRVTFLVPGWVVL
jgi:hypothetical protein